MSFSEHIVFPQSLSSVTLLGSVLFLLVLYVWSSNSKKQGKEPPGPRPLPLLGNLLQLDFKRPYLTLCKISKEYGSVFTFYMGPKKVVVLSGYKTVKQALVNHAEEFGDRDISPSADTMNGPHGILFANGESWKEMRRFALTNLRNFGMGKKAVEEKILEEVSYLVKVLEKNEGKAFDTTKSLSYAVSNIICSIVYGNRFDYSDPEFGSMIKRINENGHLLGTPSVQIYNFFPWLGTWISNRMRMRNNTDANRKQMTKLINPLLESLNAHMCRGFVDSFLSQKQRMEESGKLNTYYNIDNLYATVGNLFGAGTDTTTSTLKWCLLIMTKYPHIQDKVQEELSKVIGSRQVRVEDRKNLPYNNAVIHETQRLASILPVSVFHTTSRDITFQGYYIKKGTTVIPLLASVLWDESEWESPHSFNPSHFLDKDGRFVKRDAFMPFSAGLRACVGESLARMELFLFFTSLLQHFRFTSPPGVTEDERDLTPAVGFLLSPSPHQLCAVSRCNSVK